MRNYYEQDMLQHRFFHIMSGALSLKTNRQLENGNNSCLYNPSKSLAEKAFIYIYTIGAKVHKQGTKGWQKYCAKYT